MAGACEGIRVLDCSLGAAGSLATLMLADFGADVIKVEPPVEGTEVTPAHLLLNRGKRSVLFDHADRTHHQRLLDLIATADVLVEDWPPEVSASLGLDEDVLADANPALVHCSIIGLRRERSTGPRPGRRCIGDGEGGDLPRPTRVGTDGNKRPIYRSCPDGTYFAGMLTALGALAALRARDFTRKGQRVDASMLLGDHVPTKPPGALAAPRRRGAAGRQGVVDRDGSRRDQSFGAPP